MHRSRAVRLGGVAVFGLASLPTAVCGQDVDEDLADSVRIAGIIVDRTTEQAIPFAGVTLVRFGAEGEVVWSGSSDASGFFSPDVVPVGSYELSVDVPPYSRLTHLLVLAEAGAVDVRVEMVRVDYELPPIVVAVRRVTKLESNGFYERREEGRGTFLTREDIAERSPSRLSELFRTIPGTRILQGQFGEGSSIRLRGSCIPVYVLDGVVLSGTVVLDDVLPVAGVEGIEVYHGAAAPMTYVGMTSCGVVMLWSRDPGTRGDDGGPLTWRRALAAVGFGALVLLFTR